MENILNDVNVNTCIEFIAVVLADALLFYFITIAMIGLGTALVAAIKIMIDDETPYEKELRLKLEHNLNTEQLSLLDELE